MDIPCYQLIINEDETSDVEVSFVALVDRPAIERNFLAFKDQKLQFAIDEEKHIISGPAMVANQLIFRKDESGEYNVYFSPETVRDIAIKFFKKDYQKNLNLFHDPELSVGGVTIFESFVSDSGRGIQPMKGFEDMPDGTWFISAKVENDEVWAKVKSGEIKGFSVEGIFSYLKPVNGTVGENSHLKAENNFIMSEIKDLWKAFKDKFLGEPAPPAPQAPPAEPTTHPPIQFKEAVLKDGTKVQIYDEKVGGTVMIGDAPAPAGVLELEDGTQITVGEAGVITEVKKKEEVPPQAPQDYSENFTAIEQRFSDYETRIAQHEAAFAKQTELTTSLIELVGKIIETPTADSIVGGKNSFTTHKSESKAERIANLAQILKTIKTK